MRRCGRTAFAALALGVGLAIAAAPALAHVKPARSGTASAPPAAGDPTDAPLLDPQLDDAPDSTLDPGPTGMDDQPSRVVARIADWIIASNDNAGRPFMIVDKLGADVFAFDASGEVMGHAPVLVGLARGDDSAPGIGELKLSAIAPDERTTPAGRFDAHFGPSDGHGTVLWVDWADGISMHPVITTNPKEHRLQRIRSASPKEHRISFGCINVPAKFYHDVVEKDRHGVVVYVLPDTKPLAEVFPAFAGADEFGGDGEPGATRDRCADPMLDVADRIQDSDPAHVCAVDDDRAAAAP